MPRVKLSLPDHFTFSTEIQVRISDINYGGHLGNDAVLTLAQEARVRFLSRHGFTEHDVGGVGIIMTDAVIVYKAEAFYGDVLTIEVAVDGVELVGCDFLYRITRKGSAKEVARVKTGIAFFDYSTRRLAEVPGRFREALGLVPGAA
jgi:acyl-CoA thioester hydrolase